MSALYHFLRTSGRWSYFLAIGWTLLILVACLIPGRDVPDVSIPMIDKWVHFVIFAGFGFLWLCTRPGHSIKRCLIVLFCSILLGYAVELLQGSGITEGRSFDYYDVVADGIGGLIGVLLFLVAEHLCAKR